MNELFAQQLEEGKKCVEEYADTALAAGFIPFVSTPIVHGICIKMLAKLDEIFEIKHGPSAIKGHPDAPVNFANLVPSAAVKFANVVVGGLATPLMFIPIAGSLFGKSYVESVGERYLEAIQENHEKLLKSKGKRNEKREENVR